MVHIKKKNRLKHCSNLKKITFVLETVADLNIKGKK